MNEKMTLLCAKETRHVLALLTRAADPEAAATAEELSGGALLVRYVGDTTRSITSDARFFVPADDLEAQTVDFDEDVLKNPRAFALDADKNIQPLNLTASGLAAAPPTGSDTQVKVSLTNNVTADTPVWLNITDGSTAKTRTDKIASGTKEVTVNVGQMTPGDYYVLVLAAGLPPNSFKFTIP